MSQGAEYLYQSPETPEGTCKIDDRILRKAGMCFGCRKHGHVEHRFRYLSRMYIEPSKYGNRGGQRTSEHAGHVSDLINALATRFSRLKHGPLM